MEVALRDAWDRLSIYATRFMRRLQLVAEMHAVQIARGLAAGKALENTASRLFGRSQAKAVL